MQTPSKKTRGRGAGLNPANRFDLIFSETDPEWNPEDDRPIKTEYFRDTSKSIISYSDSPDLGPMASVNPYRGCEHGCIYCYARPTHEYFGLSSGLDFESRIFVKPKAADLLRKELSKRKWKARTVVLSGVTDCYQPVEKRLEITRHCLEVLRDFRNPAVIITKNRLVTRDIDILREMAEQGLCAVAVSITTLEKDLARKMEPRASSPSDRLKTVRDLHKAGIPVSVNVAPVVPGLTDQEIPAILKAASEAGASSAGYVVLRLPYAVKDLFVEWLKRHYPLKESKILNRIRSMRKGKLYDASYFTRGKGEGAFAEQIRIFFSVSAKKAGFPKERNTLRTDLFRNPHDQQLTLFD